MKIKNTNYLFNSELIFSYSDEEERLSIYLASNDKLMILDGALGLWINCLNKDEALNFFEAKSVLSEFCPQFKAIEIDEQLLEIERVMVESGIIKEF